MRWGRIYVGVLLMAAAAGASLIALALVLLGPFAIHESRPLRYLPTRP